MRNNIQKKRSYKNTIFVVNNRRQRKPCCGPDCAPQESKPDKEKDVQVWFGPVEVPKGPIGINPGNAHIVPRFTKCRYRLETSRIEDIDDAIPDKQWKRCTDPACQQIGNIFGGAISAERSS